MRMDPDSGTSASDWLASVDEQGLKRVLRVYGEETHATRIARAILGARDSSPILRTKELADIVAAAVPGKVRAQKKHPATKTFQAIRIAINGELEQLEALLLQSVDVLKQGGRLCVISFHSLEDRMVKRFMRDAASEPEQYRGMPSMPEELRPKMKLVGKVVVATPEEIEMSAKRSTTNRGANLMLPAKSRQPFLLVFVFAVVCVLSSIALVYTKHESRKLFVELEGLTHERDELNIEWGQLQIEQSTWATHARIERVATDDLSLARPASSEIYVIERP